MPNVSLSFVKSGTIMKQVWKACRETAERETERLNSLKPWKIVKEVCRVCRENAELQTERLCPDCARIKAHIRLRFPDAVRRTMTTSADCGRTGCVCAACSTRIFTPHPLSPSDAASADRREIHFHPRCHELWLEAAKG